MAVSDKDRRTDPGRGGTPRPGRRPGHAHRPAARRRRHRPGRRRRWHRAGRARRRGQAAAEEAVATLEEKALTREAEIQARAIAAAIAAAGLHGGGGHTPSSPRSRVVAVAATEGQRPGPAADPPRRRGRRRRCPVGDHPPAGGAGRRRRRAGRPALPATTTSGTRPAPEPAVTPSGGRRPRPAGTSRRRVAWRRPHAVVTRSASSASSSAHGAIGGTSAGCRPSRRRSPSRSRSVARSSSVVTSSPAVASSPCLGGREPAAERPVLPAAPAGDVAVRADPGGEVVAVPPVQRVVGAAAVGAPRPVGQLVLLEAGSAEDVAGGVEAVALDVLVGRAAACPAATRDPNDVPSWTVSA